MRAILAIAMALTLSGSAVAETPAQTCNRLASFPDDRDTPPGTTPVDTEAVDWKQAIPACRAAVAAEPQNRHLLTNLARALYASGSAECVRVNEQAAALGGTRAMINLAFFYASGEFVPRDEAKAGDYVEQAAKAGDLKLAIRCLRIGKGDRSFCPLSRDWYEKAVAAGVPDIALTLANRYNDDGQYDKAFVYYKKAAENGDPDGLYNLGAFYTRGKGVAPNPQESLRLYREAAAHGQRFALNALGELYRDGEGVPRDYDRARDYFEKAAAKDLTYAMTALADMYETGRGVPKDLDTTRRWYERAAALEDDDAMYALGFVYDKGEGVPQSYATAKDWFEKAAAQGNAEAMHNLAFYARMGYGGPVDEAAARRWYRAAAERGNGESMYRLAMVLDDDTAGNAKDARMWLEKAAATRHVEAMTMLGYFKVLGKGGPKDRAAARRLFEAAAAAGDADAKKALEILDEP